MLQNLNKFFYKMKHILCNRSCPMFARLRLFNASVTACALYGSAVWVLNTEQERRLKTERRRLLRKVFMIPRDKAETWIEYAERTAKIIDCKCNKLGCEPWERIHKRQKWRWAAKVAAMGDRWARTLADYRPFALHAGRRQGRPKKRWVDDLVNFTRENHVNKHWLKLSDTEFQDLESKFLDW